MINPGWSVDVSVLPPAEAAAAAGVGIERLKQLRRFYAGQIFSGVPELTEGEIDEGRRRVWRFSIIDVLVIRTVQKLSQFGFSTSEAVEFSDHLRAQFKALLTNPQGKEVHLVGFGRAPDRTPQLVKFGPDETVMDMLQRFQSVGVLLVVDLDAIGDEVKFELEKLPRFSRPAE